MADNSGVPSGPATSGVRYGGLQRRNGDVFYGNFTYTSETLGGTTVRETQTWVDPKPSGGIDASTSPSPIL